MVSVLVAMIRRTIQTLLASNSSEQLAAGFAVGMIIGLVPKGNFIALSLCVLLFSLRCNKGMAMLAAVMFSWASPWTDPFAHKLGLVLLEMQPMQAAYASMFNLPLGPWLGFHNTVVTGSLALGLYLAYPAYWAARAACAAGQRLASLRPTWRPAIVQLGGAP